MCGLIGLVSLFSIFLHTKLKIFHMTMSFAGLTGFGCFLIVVTRIQTKNEQNTTLNGDHSKRHYEKNGSPKTSAIILQNKLEQNAIRLTHSVSSPKNQLLKPPQTVKFAPLPRTKELCELDYLKPCNCKHSTVSVNV